MFCGNFTLTLSNFQGIFLQGFPLTSNQLSEIWCGLCNPPTFNITKTLESVELPPFSVNDRKVFTVKVKANITDF